jgi:hypothetical protein
VGDTVLAPLVRHPAAAGLEAVVETVRRLRAGETLMPLEEVMELLRYAGSERDQEYKACKAIETLTPREKGRSWRHWPRA